MAPRRRRGPATVRAAGCLLASLLGACHESEPRPAGPNIVLVTIDTLRADHLGAYGYFRETSPTIDELAAESLLFEACLAPMPRTAPSHTSLFTGVYPYEHGITSNVGRQLAAHIRAGDSDRPHSSLRTFPQFMQDQGYHTGGFVSATPLKKETGIAVGFDEYTQPKGHRRSAAETNRDASAWLRGVDGPFFLWVHYFDTHGPYDEAYPLPERYRRMYAADDSLETYLAQRRFADSVSNKNYRDFPTRRLIDTYDGAIRYVDEQLASLFHELRRAGVWDDTVIVLTADHGEGLGQHDFAGHGLVWREQLRVPLLLRIPGAAPRRVPTTLSLIDVFATLLGRLPPIVSPLFQAQMRGTDVLAPEFVERPVFAMSPEGAGETALFGDGWKLVQRAEGADQLFDLACDPFELDDRHGQETERARELAGLLQRTVQDMRAMGLRYGSGELVEPSEQRLAELRALGY